MLYSRTVRLLSGLCPKFCVNMSLWKCTSLFSRRCESSFGSAVRCLTRAFYPAGVSVHLLRFIFLHSMLGLTSFRYLIFYSFYFFTHYVVRNLFRSTFTLLNFQLTTVRLYTGEALFINNSRTRISF